MLYGRASLASLLQPSEKPAPRAEDPLILEMLGEAGEEAEEAKEAICFTCGSREHEQQQCPESWRVIAGIGAWDEAEEEPKEEEPKEEEPKEEEREDEERKEGAEESKGTTRLECSSGCRRLFAGLDVVSLSGGCNSTCYSSMCSLHDSDGIPLPCETDCRECKEGSNVQKYC